MHVSIRCRNVSLLLFTAICIGFVTYKLTDTSSTTNYKLECKKWHKEEFANRWSYHSALSSMPLCPCQYDFLFWDRRFSRWSSEFEGSTIRVPAIPRFRTWPHGKVGVQFDEWLSYVTLYKCKSFLCRKIYYNITQTVIIIPSRTYELAVWRWIVIWPINRGHSMSYSIHNTHLFWIMTNISALFTLDVCIQRIHRQLHSNW